MDNQYSRKWRSLVRVISLDLPNKKVEITMPSLWDSFGFPKEFSISTEGIPQDVLQILEVGKRVHAMVNIGADKVEDLMFSNWEKE